MEILPYIGFEKIKLGLTQKEVVSILGKNYNEEKESYPDNSQTFTLFYDELGCALNFSSDNNYRLDTITFYSDEFTIKGVAIIGLEEQEFISQIKDILPDIILEDHFIETDSKDFVSEIEGLSIWIQDDIVDSITIFPKYEADQETIIWPK